MLPEDVHHVQPTGCVRAVNRVERRVDLPAPPGEVWAALSEGPRLSAWFGAEISLDARPGGRATFRWPDGRERGAVVEVADVGRRLTFRWLPFERWPDGRTVVVGPGRVELDVEQVGRGTRLTVSEWGTERPDEAVRAMSPA
jgi:uncharacterized protein YndB with AHSA1/START domain